MTPYNDIEVTDLTSTMKKIFKRFAMSEYEYELGTETVTLVSNSVPKILEDFKSPTSTMPRSLTSLVDLVIDSMSKEDADQLHEEMHSCAAFEFGFELALRLVNLGLVNPITAENETE